MELDSPAPPWLIEMWADSCVWHGACAASQAGRGSAPSHSAGGTQHWLHATCRAEVQRDWAGLGWGQGCLHLSSRHVPWFALDVPRRLGMLGVPAGCRGHLPLLGKEDTTSEMGILAQVVLGTWQKWPLRLTWMRRYSCRWRPVYCTVGPCKKLL